MDACIDLQRLLLYQVTISHVTNVDVYSIVTTATTDKLITTSDQLLRAPDPRSRCTGMIDNLV